MFSAQAWQDWKPLILEHGASMFLSLLHMIVIIIAGWITCVSSAAYFVSWSRSSYGIATTMTR